jgi:hypothetical protein
MLYYNGEHYRDPTAGEALANIKSVSRLKKTGDTMRVGLHFKVEVSGKADINSDYRNFQKK